MSLSKKWFQRQMTFRLIVIILLGFILSLFVQDADADYLGSVIARSEAVEDSGAVYMQILRNTHGEPPHDPVRLAAAFTDSAKRHGLSPQLLTAIGGAESSYYVGAINKRTADYGIMQVNAYNIKKMKLSKKKLLTNIEYSVEQGARILAWFKRKYAKAEPKTWYCRYNVGTRPLKGSLKRICNRYIRTVRGKI